jgi:hypothetical protein
MVDALYISQELQQSGLSREQADSIAKSIVKAVSEREHNSKLATRRDLYLLGIVMSAGFGYLINSINNNSELLNTIVSKLS